MKKFAAWLMATLAALPLAAQDATGAGASFPAPLYARWAQQYHTATGVKINYQSMGSSAGLEQVLAGVVDFGASDEPLTDAALEEKGLVQFPAVVGAIVPVVHIEGVGPGQLRLSGQLLGDIYLGEIRRWNDARIAALNPGLALPDAPIAVVRRADGSGTTFGFTHYLSQAHPTWKAQVGSGKAVNWPLGHGGKGNEGVAAFVARLPNAIGYVEYAHAKQAGLAHVQLQTASGGFVQPDAASIRAAAAAANWQESFGQVLAGSRAENAWPLASATFVLLHENAKDAARTQAVLGFFGWALREGGEGDESARALDYVPMPQAVKDTIFQAWQRVRGPDGASLWPAAE